MNEFYWKFLQKYGEQRIGELERWLNSGKPVTDIARFLKLERWNGYHLIEKLFEKRKTQEGERYYLRLEAIEAFDFYRSASEAHNADFKFTLAELIEKRHKADLAVVLPHPKKYPRLNLQYRKDSLLPSIARIVVEMPDESLKMLLSALIDDYKGNWKIAEDFPEFNKLQIAHLRDNPMPFLRYMEEVAKQNKEMQPKLVLVQQWAGRAA